MEPERKVHACKVVVTHSIGEFEDQPLLAAGHAHLTGLTGQGKGFVARNLDLVGDDKIWLGDV